MDNNRYNSQGTGGYESPHKDEYDRMVEQIKAKRKAMSKSIWTDEPLLKPYKSIWIDDEEELQPSQPQEQEQPEVQRFEPKPEPQPEPQSQKPDPFNAYTPEYYEPNPVIRDARKEQLAFGVTPEHYDEVIMPFVNEYSVERKLPDQRKRVSLKPKANAAVDYAVKRQPQVSQRPAVQQPQPQQPEQPKVHTLRHERFFDDEGEPLRRHDPQKSRRKRPKLVPLSKRNAQEQAFESKQAESRIAAAESEPERTPQTVQTKPQVPQIEPKPVLTEFEPKAQLAEQKSQMRVQAIEPPLQKSVSEPEPMPQKSEPKAENAEAVQIIDDGMQGLNVIVCMGAIFVIAITLLVMTLMGKRETKSESEKRNLAKFPSFSLSSLFSGDFTNGITTYFTDTIPGRESFKRFNSAFTNCFGFSVGDVRVNGTLKKVKHEKYDDNSANENAVTVNTNPSGANQGTDDQKSNTNKDELVEIPENLDEGTFLGDIVVTGSGANVRGLNCFYGTFELGKNFSDTVNKWKSDLGDGVNVYAMPIPMASAYYMPKSFKDQVTDQNENIKNIIGNLNGVVGINSFNTLAKHVNEYIYARTDHHWMPLGAYYATKDFADAAGVDYPELDQYDKFTINGFVGTMYAYSNYDPQINANPDTFDYFKPKNIGDVTSTYYTTDFASTYKPITDDPSGIFYDYASGASCYSAFLNRDDEIVEINTPCKNGRTLVIFKDSFGNAMVPFLLNSFSKIYVCDFRYFQINGVDFCRKVGCTDLLFAMSVSSCCTNAQVDCINNVRVQ